MKKKQKKYFSFKRIDLLWFIGIGIALLGLHLESREFNADMINRCGNGNNTACRNIEYDFLKEYKIPVNKAVVETACKAENEQACSFLRSRSYASESE